MQKEKRIVLVYTNESPKKGDLYTTNNNLFHIAKESSLSDMIHLYNAKKVLLYVVSGEDLKVSDLFVANQSVKKCVAIKDGDYPFEVEKDGEYTQHHSKMWDGNTIIASNDINLDKLFITEDMMKLIIDKYKHQKPTKIMVMFDDTTDEILNIIL